MDKLTAMQTFVAVARAGSFSAAAQALSVPKTRVSQRIQDLEAALSVRLLNRTTRVVSPTEEGRLYLAQYERLLEDLAAAESQLALGRDEPAGRLQVSCMSLVARVLILPRLDAFLAAHPRLSVALSVTDRLVNLPELGLDCAIRGGQMDSSSLISRRIGRSAFGLYAAPGLHAGAVAHPSALADLPLIKTTRQRDGQLRHWSLLCGTERHEETSLPRLETDDDHVALEAACAGAGVALLPDFAARPAVAAGALQPVLPGWAAPERSIYALYPSRRYVPAKLRCFLDWVEGLM